MTVPAEVVHSSSLVSNTQMGTKQAGAQKQHIRDDDSDKQLQHQISDVALSGKFVT